MNPIPKVRTRCLGVILAATVGMPATLVSPHASAAAAPSDDDLQQAKRLYERGTARFDAGAFTEAAGLFVSAYELSGEPNLLYNASYAFERAQDTDNALRYLRKYRDLAPPDERAGVDEEIAQLERRQSAAETNEDLEPEKINATPAGDTPPKDDAPVETRRIFGPGAAVLTGTAVLGAGVAIGFGVAALTQRNTVADQCSEDGSLCPGTVDGVERKRKIFAAVADAGIALTAVSVVALTAVLLVNRKRAQRDKVALQIAPDMTRSSAGVWVRGRF